MLQAKHKHGPEWDEPEPDWQSETEEWVAFFDELEEQEIKASEGAPHIQPNLHRSFETVMKSTLKFIWYAVPEILCRNLIEVFWFYGLSATLFLKKWLKMKISSNVANSYIFELRKFLLYRQDKILELLR